MQLYNVWAKEPKPKFLSPFWKFYGNFEGEVEISFIRNPSGLRILDLGCRDGRFIRQLTSNGAHAVGIDLSLDCIKLAQQSLLKNQRSMANFIVCDAEKLPFREKSFDCVAILFLLHHLPSFKVLKESHDILNQKGTLILNEPVKNNILIIFGTKIYSRLSHSIRNRMLQDLEDNSEFAPERSALSRWMLNKALDEARFDIIKEDGRHLFLFPLEYFIRLVPNLRFIFTEKVLFGMYHLEMALI